MTKEQEAQQAQAIAEIRADVKHRALLVKGAISMERRWRAADAQLKELLEIVDSQAQKIAEQAELISAQGVQLVNLRYDLQTARIQAEGCRSDIINGHDSQLKSMYNDHEFEWER